MNRDLQLWIAVFVSPTVWLASFLANFAIAPWACSLGWKPALFVVTGVSLALTAGSGVMAWRMWRQVGVEMPGEIGGAVAHARRLALAGVLLSSMFFLVIVAQAVPNVMLGACE